MVSLCPFLVCWKRNKGDEMKFSPSSPPLDPGANLPELGGGRGRRVSRGGSAGRGHSDHRLQVQESR